MKLAIITTHPVQYNAPLFKHLQDKEGWNIHVFYTRAQQDAPRYDADFGQAFSWDIPLLEGYPHTFIRNAGRKKGFFRAVNPGLIKAVKAFAPDAIMVFGWDMYSHFRVMRYFKGRIPVLFRGDSTLLDDLPQIKDVLRKIVLKMVYRNIDVALYTGKANKAYFQAHGVSGERLVFAPHAIDNERFMQDTGSREQQAREWRSKLGIPDHGIVVLFAAKFTPKKQPDFLIRAARRLHQKDVHFVLAGSGKMEAELRRQAISIVHFLPFQNQKAMPVLYRMADLFVLPSKGPAETWGLAVNEAMACARPALVSNRAGCAHDLIKPGKTGQVFDPFYFPDFYAKLKAMLDKPLLELMGSQAQEEIKTWNYEAIGKAINTAISKAKAT